MGYRRRCQGSKQPLAPLYDANENLQINIYAETFKGKSIDVFCKVLDSMCQSQCPIRCMVMQLSGLKNHANLESEKSIYRWLQRKKLKPNIFPSRPIGDPELA